MSAVEAEFAAAKLLDKASVEIAGAVAELIAAARDRGDNLDLTNIASEITIAMLASGWELALFAIGDEVEARKVYAQMLRRMAERVDQQ